MSSRLVRQLSHLQTCYYMLKKTHTFSWHFQPSPAKAAASGRRPRWSPSGNGAFLAGSQGSVENVAEVLGTKPTFWSRVCHGTGLPAHGCAALRARRRSPPYRPRQRRGPGSVLCRHLATPSGTAAGWDGARPRRPAGPGEPSGCAEAPREGPEGLEVPYNTSFPLSRVTRVPWACYICSLLQDIPPILPSPNLAQIALSALGSVRMRIRHPHLL